MKRDWNELKSVIKKDIEYCKHYEESFKDNREVQFKVAYADLKGRREALEDVLTHIERGESWQFYKLEEDIK